MAESSYPFGSSEIATEDQWSSYFRMAQIDGVYAVDPTGTDLRVTGSNASTVAVAAGEAWIQGTYYANGASLNVAVPTNSGGGTARKDLVVLRRDPTADATTVQYKTGGTSFPTLAQTLNGTWEIPLAQVTVAAGASVVAPSEVVDQRWFLGRSVALSNPGARPPATKGQLVVEGRTVYLGNGVGWDALATAGQDTDWKLVTLNSGYAASGDAPAYRIKDGMVFLRGSIAFRYGGHLVNTELTTFATVPREAWPIGHIRYGVAPTEFRTYTAGTVLQSFFHARVEIQTNGELKYWLPRNSPAEWLGLDGLSYSL